MRTGTERHSRVCAIFSGRRNRQYFFNPDAIIKGIENILESEKEKYGTLINHLNKLSMETEFKKIKWQS
jgi:hypothetical protein